MNDAEWALLARNLLEWYAGRYSAETPHQRERTAKEAGEDLRKALDARLLDLMHPKSAIDG